MNRVTPTMGPAPTAMRHAPVVHDRMRVARSVLCRKGQVSSSSPSCMFIRYDDAAEDVIDPHPINIVNYAGRIGLRPRAQAEKRTHGWVRRKEVIGREMAFRIEAPKGAGRLAGQDDLQGLAGIFAFAGIHTIFKSDLRARHPEPPAHAAPRAQQDFFTVLYQ